MLASISNELSRIWLAPRASVRERADAVNRAFTNGTPMAEVVAALGTNYIQGFSSARVWLGPGPEPPNTPWLSYRFGEEDVTIHTSATISEGPLKGKFTGAGYSLEKLRSTQTTNRIRIGQPDGATNAGSRPVSSGTNPAATATEEEVVIEVARQWYRTNSWAVPPRIVVDRKTNDIWVLEAGPRDATLKVNLKTREVVEFIPGF